MKVKARSKPYSLALAVTIILPTLWITACGGDSQMGQSMLAPTPATEASCGDNTPCSDDESILPEDELTNIGDGSTDDNIDNSGDNASRADDIQFSLAFEFSNDEYDFLDFTLKDYYRYFEIRSEITADEPDIENRIQVYAIFNQTTFTLSNTEQKAELENISSQQGIRKGCGPSCIFYAVAVSNDDVLPLTSRSELLDFFNQVDTEAELYWWLWAKGYTGLKYDVVPGGGYLAYAHWVGNPCVFDYEGLLFVDTNGVITQLKKEVSTRFLSYCF